MSTNRALSAVNTDFDLGRPLATRSGKVIHRLMRLVDYDGNGQASCGKVLPVILPKHVTIADRKRRWGVLLGGGRAALPTCPECLASHYAEIESRRKVDPREALEDKALKNIDAVPATKEGHEALKEHFSAKSPQDAQVGDLVYLYSRGKIRRAIVVKVTPTKVHAFYTTEGGVKEAVRIYDSIAARDPQEVAKGAADMASRNYSYYRRAVAEMRERIERGDVIADWERKSFESDLKVISEETREEHVARKATEAYEATVARKEGNKSYRQYVNYTTKDAKKDDVYLV